MLPTSSCVIVLAPRDDAEEVVLDRAGDADNVDAVVLVESLVLDGDERLADVFRKGSDRHARAPLRADFADQRSVAGVDERRLRRRDDLPGFASAGLRLGR